MATALRTDDGYGADQTSRLTRPTTLRDSHSDRPAGAAKTTSVGRSSFTAAAASILQFLLIDIDGDRLDARCIQVDGQVADQFTLRARENR